MHSEQVTKAVLEQVGPPTPLPSKIVDYVIGEIMKAQSTYSRMFSGSEAHVDEVFVEILPTSHRPRVRQWWVQDARLKMVSLDPKKEVVTVSTLGLTGVARVDLKMKWLTGTGRLTIRDASGRNIVIRQTVVFEHGTPVDWGGLAPRVRRFLNLGKIVQEHVI